MIAKLSEAMGADLVGNSSIENFISHEKLHCPKYTMQLKSFKQSFLTIYLSQYCRWGSTFSSSEPVAASSDCRRLSSKMPRLLLTRPRPPHQAVPDSCPKSLQSNPSPVLWNSLWRDCQMTGRGLNLDSDLNSAAACAA